MTAVYSCVRILSEAIASLPLHLYRYTDSCGKEKATDSPLYFLLHDEPNPEMTSFVFRETLMTHLLLWGNAYAQIIRNGKGEVTALYPLMPDRMTVDRDKNGRAAFSTATDLFLFRCIPNVEVTTDMLILCNNRKFEITSVENVKGRNMYLEVLAKEVKPSG